MTAPKRPMRRVGELLPSLASELGLEEELRRAHAMTSWEQVVRQLVPPAAGASQLLEVRPGELLVSADDPRTGQELRLHADVLLRAFAAAPGGSRRRELRVVIRPPGARRS